MDGRENGLHFARARHSSQRTTPGHRTIDSGEPPAKTAVCDGGLASYRSLPVPSPPSVASGYPGFGKLRSILQESGLRPLRSRSERKRFTTEACMRTATPFAVYD